jgi:hypothetical protein
MFAVGDKRFARGLVFPNFFPQRRQSQKVFASEAPAMMVSVKLGL